MPSTLASLSLTKDLPHSSAEGAAAIARDLFGVGGRAVPLGGERDHNFRLDTDDGRSFVLKFSDPSESESAEFQAAALAHIALTDPVFPVSRGVPTLAGGALGRAWIGETPRDVRLLTWIAGDVLCQVDVTPALLAALGAVAARLDLALADFAVPVPDRQLLWDFASVARVRELAEILQSDPALPLADAALARFEQQAPAIAELRRQPVHNDLNPHNVIVDAVGGRDITGVLDFGDMVHGSLIGELAIACSYHLNVGETPLEGAAACVAGYHAVLPLTALELHLLPTFIAARLAMTVLITEWRATQHSNNKAYILRNNPAARSGLQRLEEFGPDGARNLLTRHVSFAAP